MDFEDQTFSFRFGGTVTTDEEGKFELDRLVVGHEYELRQVVKTDSEGRSRMWRQAGKITATTTDMLDVGDIWLERPYRPPTIQERIVKAFGNGRPLEERFKIVHRDARLGFQRALLVVGKANSPLIEQIYEMNYERRNSGVARTLADYVFLPIDSGKSEMNIPLLELSSRLNFSFPGEEDVELVVLDEAGQSVAETSLGKMAGIGPDGATIDTAKVDQFLHDNRAKLPDAEAVVSDALARARRDGLRVLVQQSGPRCRPCVLLSRFLDDHHALIDKQFIYIKIDARFEHGRDVIERLRQGSEGGIPWMVILDADGNRLATSDGPNGNIGFPSSPAGIAHFEQMLRTSANRWTAAEIQSLVGDLSEGDK